jgi:hypothetical protein
MNKYKDEHGKTRVGAFIKGIAPELLSVAAGLTGIQALNVIGNAIEGSGKLTVDQKAQAKELLQLDLMLEKEITARHAADMASDSLLSKNIRPLALIYLLVMVTFLAFFDAAKESFNVPEAYVSLVTQLLIMVFGFYFIGREVQKGIINFKKNKS